MQQADQVGAVVHRDRRTACRARRADGCSRCRDPRRESRRSGCRILLDQRGGDIVLSRERIRRAAEHFGAARLQRAQQIGGLAGDMQAGAQTLALERLGSLAKCSRIAAAPASAGRPIRCVCGPHRPGRGRERHKSCCARLMREAGNRFRRLFDCGHLIKLRLVIWWRSGVTPRSHQRPLMPNALCSASAMSIRSHGNSPSWGCGRNGHRRRSADKSGVSSRAS